MKTKYIWFAFVLIGLTGCQNDDEGNIIVPGVDLTAGSADFSNFVAIGNSLTAGFTDNALFIAAQQNSMPNLMAQQFGLVGGGVFTQPLTNDNIGGLTLGGNVIAAPRLYFDGAVPALLPGLPTTEVSNILSGPFNNMGVPGARGFHLLANGFGNIGNIQLGLANPYFVRMASSPNASVLEDALAQSPTFFSLWIGNNDVLGYATSGGDGSSSLTDQATFAGAYNAIVSAIGQTGAQGVIANIPDVTSIPYFTTVPHNPLDPSNPAFGPQIAALNAAFAPLNAAFDFLGMPERKVVFSETAASALVIHDESLPNIAGPLSQVLQGGGLDPLTAGLLAAQYGQSRQATADDLVVLPSATAIATLNTDYFNFLVNLGVPPATAGQLSVNGLTFPFEDKWVLLPSEQMEVKLATEAFNAVISSAAQGGGYAFVDANALLGELDTSGLTSGNFTFTSSLVTGGAFGLDGVHPTSRGYALVANEFLKAIDAAYGSTFNDSGNLLNVGDYPTNYSPLLN